MPERHDEQSERIGAAIRAAAAGVEAPDALRARIAAGRAGRGARHRAWPWALAAMAVAALAVALVVALPSSPGGPTPADAAAAALRAPTRPAPPVDAADPRFVEASVEGVRFPNYAYDTSWRAVGARADVLHGRSARTVVYARGDVRVGYAIVAGPPLPVSAGWSRVDAAGTPVWVARRDGALVVAWERGGHTCVLASRAATLPQILGFVAGRGDA